MSTHPAEILNEPFVAPLMFCPSATTTASASNVKFSELSLDAKESRHPSSTRPSCLRGFARFRAPELHASRCEAALRERSRRHSTHQLARRHGRVAACSVHDFAFMRRADRAVRRDSSDRRRFNVTPRPTRAAHCLRVCYGSDSIIFLASRSKAARASPSPSKYRSQNLGTSHS